MKIAVFKERLFNETRVAASPEAVKKYVAAGHSVSVEQGAGAASYFGDDLYREAGAEIAPDRETAISGARVLLKVRAPDAGELALLPAGVALVGMLSPYGDPESVAAYASAKVDAFTMEFMPRITRAQSMDVLSSQSNLAGYKSVLDATAVYGRAMPMMMTAAGTIAPARVMVMGAGVAGLQAIATARRLGAIVSATDVRAAAKEQVQSLGATFVMVESEETSEAETAGGYAKEMSEDYKRRQAELIAETLKKQDIAICTALIPGRPAPVLITEDMVKSMKPGSVIVDLAVEQGGNCPLSRAGEIVEAHGVSIVGHNNVPGRLPGDASSLYAKNLLNFINLLVDAESSELKIDWQDEIVLGTALTRDGAVIHPNFAEQEESS